jgi:hypothetical protein
MPAIGTLVAANIRKLSSMPIDLLPTSLAMLSLAPDATFRTTTRLDKMDLEGFFYRRL